MTAIVSHQSTRNLQSGLMENVTAAQHPQANQGDTVHSVQNGLHQLSMGSALAEPSGEGIDLDGSADDDVCETVWFKALKATAVLF